MSPPWSSSPRAANRKHRSRKPSKTTHQISLCACIMLSLPTASASISFPRARRFGETEPNLLLARQSSPPNGQTEMMQPPLCILDAPHPFGYSFSARRCHNPSRSLYQTCIIHSFSLSHLHHHLFFFSHFNFSSPLSLSLIFQIFCSSIRPTACMFPLFPFPSSFSLDFESSHTCFRLLHFAKHASLLPR